LTFSSRIRRELAHRHLAHADDEEWSLVSFAAFASTSGHIEETKGGWQLTLRVGKKFVAPLLEAIFRTLSLKLSQVTKGKRDVKYTVFVPHEKRPFLFFDFHRWIEETEEAGLEPIFAAFFLGSGVMSDPTGGRYRLSFSPSSGGAVGLMTRVFKQAGFSPTATRHQGKIHLLFSNGEEVARFLLLSGAHNALLAFEETRSERELIGQVNRQVNFDDANAGRRAESIARQLEAIAIIEALRGISSLPPPLVDAAKARLENKGASLEELGETMDPPVSKSGMSHRFSRIRSIANSLAGDKLAEH
jgi:DNA-binding protein WhiA